MQLSFGQHMKMSQQMKLAPRMIQSMEILQLPIMALKERIEQELSENPLLEEPIVETDGSAPVESSESGESVAELPAEKPMEQKELLVDSDHNNKDDFERLTEMSPDEWPDDDYSYSPRVSSNRMDEDG